MAELRAQSPFAGLELPLASGDCRLSELPFEPMTAIAPFPGREGAVDKGLKPLGLRFPVPGESLASGGVRIVWAGRACAFLIGAEVPEAVREHAALSDQSDGWAGLRLEGSDGAAVLARLVPIDLRLAAFAPGQCARTLVNHLPALILRTTPGTLEIRVYRSMAATLLHEVGAAMRGIAARRGQI